MNKSGWGFQEKCVVKSVKPVQSIRPIPRKIAYPRRWECVQWLVEAKEGIEIPEKDEFAVRKRRVEIFVGAQFDRATQMVRRRRDGGRGTWR